MSLACKNCFTSVCAIEGKTILLCCPDCFDAITSPRSTYKGEFADDVRAWAKTASVQDKLDNGYNVYLVTEEAYAAELAKYSEQA